jgi:hypothetical protein
MAGPFWEPSIFGAVLSLALLLTNLFIKKKRYLYWGIFGICLLLSRSTGGILLGLLSFAALLFENPSKKIRIIRISILLSSIACAILLLVFLLPNLQKMFPTFLSKISLDSVTFTTRLYSPYYFFLVFLKKPVIGLGPQVAFSTYSSIVDATTVDSATSSFGFFTASFGIPGLLYCLLILVAPFFVKRWNFSTRIIVSLFSLLLFNLENIAYLSIFLLFASYCQKEGLFGTLYLSTSTPEPDKGRNLLFAKSGDGSLARNLNGSLLVKGASMLVGVVAIPVYNRYFVSDDLYGAWLTVVSVLSWTLLFDFGFGSGLRSKLGQAIDNHDEKAQSSLISSTYIGTFAISLFFLAVLMVLIWTVDLNSLLKVPVSALNPVEMKLAMTVLSFGLFFEFVFKNIIYILYAVRRSAIASSFALISNVSLLAFFSISSSFSFSNRFLVAAFVYALTVNVPLFVASFIFFSHKHKREWLPSFHKFRWDICRKVMGVGIAFFGIQIGFFVLSQTDSFLVSSIFSSADVVAYTKYSKIFTFFISLMGAVVQQPIWSAVSTAWSKQDKRGIKKYLKMCLVIAGALFAFCLVAGACLQLIFNVWLGDYSLQVNYLYMFIFVMYSFAYLFSDALIIVCNGLLIIKGQAIITLASAAVKMVLVYTLCLLWKENPLSWCLIVLIDGACYLPYLFALPQLIHKKIALIPEAPSRVEK